MYYYLVSIDVPWGRICGKAWGSSSGKPILALHGRYICVDLFIHKSVFFTEKYKQCSRCIVSVEPAPYTYTTTQCNLLLTVLITYF